MYKGMSPALGISHVEKYIPTVMKQQAAELLQIGEAETVPEKKAHTLEQAKAQDDAADRLIAAHALSIGATVVTSNRADFADVPGLAVEDWTA